LSRGPSRRQTRHVLALLAGFVIVCAFEPRDSSAQFLSPPTLTLSEAAVLAASASQQAPVVPVAPPSSRQRTDVSAAIGDSFKLLAIEHAFRISFQEKTRKELSGPFWPDYVRSVRVPQQWSDTDAWYVNYIGHPIHGAAAGYNWLDHGPDGDVRFGKSPRYWAAKGRATAWAAAYSLQFEVGPLSEASIGNVGMRPETTGWVDHVVTPAGAFGLMVAEDALDRFLVEWAEERVQSSVLRASMRILFNPARALSNGATGRAPWHRDGRPLSWR
jgi:hypothetical protein